MEFHQATSSRFPPESYRKPAGACSDDGLSPGESGFDFSDTISLTAWAGTKFGPSHATIVDNCKPPFTDQEIPDFGLLAAANNPTRPIWLNTTASTASGYPDIVLEEDNTPHAPWDPGDRSTAPTGWSTSASLSCNFDFYHGNSPTVYVTDDYCMGLAGFLQQTPLTRFSSSDGFGSASSGVNPGFPSLQPPSLDWESASASLNSDGSGGQTPLNSESGQDGSGARSHPCQECGKSFTSRKDLDRHCNKSAVHGKKPSARPDGSVPIGFYGCRCDSIQTRKDLYRRHLRTCRLRQVRRHYYSCKCGHQIVDKEEHHIHIEACGRGKSGRPRKGHC